MGTTLQRIAHRFFNGHSNLNISNNSDLLVIEAPYFSKPIDGREDQTRYAFISAHREDGGAPWRVSTQSYTRTYYTDGSIMDSDFDHGKECICESDAEVLQYIQDFQIERISEGYEQHEKTSSSYAYGLPLMQAKRYLDLSPQNFSFTPR